MKKTEQKTEMLINNEINEITINEVTKDETLILEKNNFSSLRQTLKTIASLAFPTILFWFALLSQISVCLFFLNLKYKNLDMEEAIGFSNLILNVSMLSIVVGLIGGLEILGSTAYGAKNYKLLGIYLHRARIISLSVALILLLIFYFSLVPIMNLFKRNSEVQYYAIRFSNMMIFSVLIEVIFRSNYVYLNIVNKAYVNTIIITFSLILHVFWNYILICLLDLDTLGSGISMILSQGFSCLLSLIYMNFFTPLPESIFWINRLCFNNLLNYVKVALPSTLLMCFEWWSFEFLSLFALQISEDSYKIHIIVWSIYIILCTFIQGPAVSMTILCSKSIGEKNIINLKKYFKIHMIFFILQQVVIALLLFIFKKPIIRLYTVDEKLVDIISEIIVLLSGITILDLTQYMLNSYAKSCGKLWQTSLICFSVFYGVQISMAYVFSMILKMGVYGVWLSCFLSLTTVTIAYSVLILFFKYDDIIKLMTEKISNENITEEISL